MKRIVIIGLLIVFQSQVSLAEDIAHNGYDLVRNGGFESTYDVWYLSWASEYVKSEVRTDAAKDGNNGLRLKSSADGSQTFSFQPLMIPTRLDTTTLRFDYRTQDSDDYAEVKNHPSRIEVLIYASNEFDNTTSRMGLQDPPLGDPIATLPPVEIDKISDWSEYRTELDPSAIDAIQAAHDNGDFVYLALIQRPASPGDSEQCLMTSIDNVSMPADGTQVIPQMQGLIAYTGENDDHKFQSINILDPNTRDVNTIWTHPKDYSSFGGEVAWSPDGSTLAFTGSYIFGVTGMDLDIVTIRNDGSNLLRLTETIPVSDKFKELQPRNLSWRHDGSLIYFSMKGFHSIPADKPTKLGWTYIKPDGNLMGSQLSWSPVDDRYLYVDTWTTSFQHYLYMAEPNGEPRQLVDNATSPWTRPEWLPNGSGFVYRGSQAVSAPFNLYFYDMKTEKAQPLTYFQKENIGDFSISPDGRYIVFEKWVYTDSLDSSSYKSDLWIMDRLNPVEIWPITDSGNCTNPSWSGAKVPGYDGGGEKGSGDEGGGDKGSGGKKDGDKGKDKKESSGSSGGGGCFLDSISIHPHGNR